MAERSRGFVDYDSVADLYQEGRTLPADVLDRWRSAVTPHLPARTERVLDVGAGTGIFARVWSDWAGASVVAVEPSEAMVRQARPAHVSAAFVRSVAEALPLRAESVDVVWVSAALHHFLDVGRAAAELARVLRGAGRLFVRTYVPGRTEVTFANEFPGRASWEARFHTEPQLRAIFESQGFELRHIAEVLEWSEPFARSAQWAEKMRHADSMFTALTDEQMAQGLDALRSRPNTVGRLELTLAVFDRSQP